ncbi:MAG TPA: DnaJ C-terminal domain-containing protein [Dongiaceae bacterium]
MEFKDYYQALGVARDASADDIKRAYRKLARQYHPDINKAAGAEARFKEIGEAHDVLKDPEKRAAYDQVGAGFKAGQEFRPPPGWDAGFEHGESFSETDAQTASDFFEALFGRGARRARGGRGGFAQDGSGFAGNEGFSTEGFKARGGDHQAKVLIDLEDAYRGATRALSLRAVELGKDGRPHMRERTLNVKIPKGVRQGQQIRLAGQGDPGIGGGPAGDLYLEIEFNPHSLYRVEGGDVYLDLPVAPWEAVLGRKVRAPTPDGAVDLKVPAGSRSGQKLRLKGRGIPASTPGDLYVVLQIVLPPATGEAAQKVYREMEEKLAFNPRAGLGV